MKKLEKALSDRGFTLVEMVVTLMITVILLVTIGSVFLMSQKIYTRGTDISYKEGVVTNAETNLQNYLSKATDVDLLSAPQIDKECYNIGFANDGTCEEIIVSPNIEGTGFISNRNTLSQISNIFARATLVKIKESDDIVATLNYQLIPFKSMSVLNGGIELNNFDKDNVNLLEQNLTEGRNLNDAVTTERYLVLTFGDVENSSEEPATNINDQLEDKGVSVGNWNNMIANAKVSEPYGYTFQPEGAVYSDSTGTFVTAKAQYISRSFAEGNPTAQAYYDSLGGQGNDYFLKISKATHRVTGADYETDPTKWGCIWKVDQYPELGDLYLYEDEYYIWESKSSSVYSPKNADTGNNWLKLVDAPSQFQ